MGEQDDQLSDLQFWQNKESCVLANRRSAELVQFGAKVEDWISQQDDAAACVWIATSGSSGRSRFVAIAKAALWQSAMEVNRHLFVTSDDHWLAALPGFHVGGLAVYVRALQAQCEMTLFEQRWDAHHFCEALETRQITLTSLVPTQVYDLVSQGLKCPQHLRALIVGGEKLDVELGRSARALQWPVLQSYGMTEAGSQIATEPLSALQRDFAGEWLAVLPNWQVREQAKGGSLQIKGGCLCRGYLEQAASGELEFKAAGDAEGWFTTGDRVEIKKRDGKTKLKVLGRMDDLIKVLGEQVSMNQLNQCLQKLRRRQSEQVDAVLVAVPDERKGYRIIAAASGDDRAIQSLLDAYRQQAAPYERIDEVKIVRFIPRSALGKVERKLLLQQLKLNCP
ncbi:MAG: AMP-binding protein [Verrucomicrobiota bacterium]